MALFMTPMMVPVIVAAADMFFLFSDFSLQGTFIGVIIAHTVLGTPFVVVTVTASLSQFDGNLMRAACSLGSPPWHAFRTVMLPIILPGVISGTPFASLLRRRGRRAFHWKLSAADGPLANVSGIREQIRPTILAAAKLLEILSVPLLAALEILHRRSERTRAAT